MNDTELNEETRLYFDHYSVISYISTELQPQAMAYINMKLTNVLESLRMKINEDNNLVASVVEGKLELEVYTKSDGVAWTGNQKVCIFLALERNFKEANSPSRIGITCTESADTLQSLKDAQLTGSPDWLSNLTLAHGRQVSKQLYKTVDWYEQYDTFEIMKSELLGQITDLAANLHSFLQPEDNSAHP